MSKKNKSDLYSNSYKDLMDLLVKNTLNKHGVKSKKSIPTKEKHALRNQFKALEQQVQKFINKGKNNEEEDTIIENEMTEEMNEEMEETSVQMPRKKLRRIRTRRLK